jgi:hypothetical protein
MDCTPLGCILRQVSNSKSDISSCVYLSVLNTELYVTFFDQRCRERTVVALIALGAAPGALTDPTPDFPGSTPADLASANGHRGISGFLAESSLTSHLQALNLKEANMAEISGLPGIGDVTDRSSSQPAIGDSLSAVRNAAQAAARIYQFNRIQSFQRKQAVQYEDDKSGISDERALPLMSVKSSRPGKLDPLHAAASRIQNKYRGWKGRKEFLLIRQRIVKIQVSQLYMSEP